MSVPSPYPQFDCLFGVYLNQDCAYWGETLEEVVGSYKKDGSPEEINALLSDPSSCWTEVRGRGEVGGQVAVD
jgi:hypothetical protein